MAMAKPVIVTTQALEGIDAARPGRDVLLANTEDEISGTACKLVTGEITGAPIGSSARECVVGNYGWAARLSKFDTLIANAANA